MPTDLEETPAGLSDLFAVCRAVQVPVLQWDWFVHPLQVRYSSSYGSLLPVAEGLHVCAGCGASDHVHDAVLTEHRMYRASNACYSVIRHVAIVADL